MPSNYDCPVVIETSARYPEIPARGIVDSHAGVASLFSSAALPSENPFGEWIRPGMKVLVKPNWVRHAAAEWAELEPLVTHPSVIRPVVEAIAKALTDASGRISGEIVLADAPLQSADFDLILHQSGIIPLVHFWHRQGIPIRLADLRRVIVRVDEESGVVKESVPAHGDPRGDTVVDLGTFSRLEGVAAEDSRMGVSNYDSRQTSAHHGPGYHRYRIANSLLDSDVVVNLPKWKTHVKTGITGALKNFIGVNCDKAFLPHFRVGSPRQGGDEYPDSMSGEFLARVRPVIEQMVPGGFVRAARQVLLRTAKETGTPVVFGGAWPGNDTLWRTVHDMVHIARWLGPVGMRRQGPRPVLTILDAIVAGEGDGPLRPEARPMGCLFFGTDPGWMDAAAAAASGFAWESIPLLRHLIDQESAAITRFQGSGLPGRVLDLKPPLAWANTICSEEVRNEAA